MMHALVVQVKNTNIAMALTNKPVIGITIDYRRDDEMGKYSDFPWYALRQHYSEAVAKFGGIPLFLPFEAYKNIENIKDLLDGLLIPGGDHDVPPSFYGQEIKFKNVYPAEDRCQAEIPLINYALAENMPVFAICHGMQLLNVMLGGTLLQNLEAQHIGAIPHRQPLAKDQPYHDLKITSNSKLAAITNGVLHFKINSFHRQAVDKLGKGLIVSGICPEDGIIEAIESTDHVFVHGVEWHPEVLVTTGLDDKLFSAFINAANDFQQRKSSNQ